MITSFSVIQVSQQEYVPYFASKQYRLNEILSSTFFHPYWSANKTICVLELPLCLVTYKTVEEKSARIRASTLICQSDLPGRY